jgi:hypothetical protein
MQMIHQGPPTGQNYASCGKKMVKILPQAVKNGQNFATGGEKWSKLCLLR